MNVALSLVLLPFFHPTGYRSKLTLVESRGQGKKTLSSPHADLRSELICRPGVQEAKVRDEKSCTTGPSFRFHFNIAKTVM